VTDSLATIEPAEIVEAAEDPSHAVLVLLGQAKAFLVEATDLEDVVDFRAKADAVRVYTVQKKLSEEARLSASEMVRRAEWRLGQLLVVGQERGDIATVKSNPGNTAGVPDGNTAPSTLADIGITAKESHEFKRMNDVDDATFDEIVDEARAEGNLSRANIIRKTRQRADDELEEALDELGLRRGTKEDAARTKEHGRARGAISGIASTVTRGANDKTPAEWLDAYCQPPFDADLVVTPELVTAVTWLVDLVTEHANREMQK
jgi:hypothetical protein